MGAATRVGLEGCAVSLDGQSFDAVAVDLDNPHVVARVPDPGALGALDGVRVEPAAAFPDGVNVEFVAPRGEREYVVRVHERGVGETFSCGTGACAVVAALAAGDGAGDGASYHIVLPGGRLTVTSCPDRHLLLTGPAVLVAQGVVREEWLAAVGSVA
jgi:diaminopimelate epimerase